MVKTLLITAALIIIIVLLLFISVKPPALITKPAEKPITITPETPTPKAPPPPVLPPTKRAEETTPPPGGVPAEIIYPQEVHFWVNDIRTPTSTSYEEGFNFIPIKQSQLKTFAGSFGPYFEDPTPYLKVILCAELYKVQAAPACETAPIIFRDRYVSFARGYQFDEYIGGMAAKDYIAYYDVYVGGTRVASSNRAVVRTVKD